MNHKITKKGVGRPKSQQKRIQILNCAAELVLAYGYVNTSMDTIAKASGVSKQTVYSHFNSKESLYKAIVEAKCDMYQIHEEGIRCSELSLQEILVEIGIKFVKLLNDENVIAMYKVVIGESKHDTTVAELFYKAGPQHSVELVTNIFVKHPESKLTQEQAIEVSHDFFNLLKADYHMPCLLHLKHGLDANRINHIAQKAAKKTMLIISMFRPHN